ncbi:PREDICTED: uncharacterized protein LOC109168019 [Ipomoea nil]|uniref:uncharacterized protein LOC109168019 n=1 Tax=Ipomoea nil TaxID=35883 RepID=UPI000901CC50|nr:PREDICTED: uncharacterized protein LOC109168019 [Ipomoea nil]
METGDGNQAGSSSNQTLTNKNQRSEGFDNPLFLHVTENPNLNLVSPSLTELNYASWSRSMRIALEVKNKFAFAEGTIPRPEINDLKLASWRRCNRIVCSWILKSINPSIADSNEIFRNVQGSLTVNEYCTKSNALWQQMNALRPLLLCEYIEKVLNMTLKVERKIRGSINQKCNEFIQSNVVQTAKEQATVVASAFNNKKKFTNNGGKNVPKCTFCGMIGHTIEKCYKKHGYPLGRIPGYKSKNRQPQDMQQSSNASVSQIGDNQNKGNQAASNAAVTISSSGTKPDLRNSVEVHDEGITTSKLLVNTVLSSGDAWILDSGAIDLIICSPEFFETCHRVQGISVKLTNDETVIVTHIGQVRLNNDIVLQNVLYIPSFAFNVISASKLTKHSNCKLILQANSCAVQGPLGRMDGFAKEESGMYLISEPPAKNRSQSAAKLVENQCNALTL